MTAPWKRSEFELQAINRIRAKYIRARTQRILARTQRITGEEPTMARHRLAVEIGECHEEAHADIEGACPCMGTYEFTAYITPYDHGRHGHIDNWYPPEGGVEDVESFTKDGQLVDNVPGWLREEAMKAASQAASQEDAYEARVRRVPAGRRLD